MIYMDKMLKEGMLIQAMSRTNRTLNRDSKPHGKVRFYRQGDAMKEYVENAFNVQLVEHQANLPGVISRKKQVVPAITRAINA